MSFLLSVSENDVKSGDMKIKPGTSNVFDPIEKVYVIDKAHEILDPDAEDYGQIVADCPEEMIDQIIKDVENGYRPIIKIIDSLGQFEEIFRYTASVFGGDISALLPFTEGTFITFSTASYWMWDIINIWKENKKMYLYFESGAYPYSEVSVSTMSTNRHQSIKDRLKAILEE